jgi:sugar (pentulose or hexulose) kinase
MVMSAQPVIAIFDIGKTNKKLFLFDESYKIVYEETVCFPETVDEDGDRCEDLQNLQTFVFSSLQKVFQNKAYKIKAVNFSTYGASFVHLDANGRPVTPLYNYLKTFPKELLRQFYNSYGGEHLFSVTTASPVLGHLNSGMQLYWLKYKRPQLFKKVRHSLHLPQYMSYLLTGRYFSDVTSIGCHTGLWDFSKQQYHEWVDRENIAEKLAPIVPSTYAVYPSVRNGHYTVGVGLHDSSAALIPYLASFSEPFVLLSTGTWCISLNPFNQTPLTYRELQKDCLCYLTYEGTAVKASRLFAGNEHEQQVKRLAEHFSKPKTFYKSVTFDASLLTQQATEGVQQKGPSGTLVSIRESSFADRELSAFASYEEAYHRLIQDIVLQQVEATKLVVDGTGVKRIFVDGGFSNNPIYINLLAAAFPEIEVFAASMAQATALGAALAIHSSWNQKALPTDMIELKYYSSNSQPPI